MREIKFRAWDKENNCYFKNTDEAYKGNIEQLFIGVGRKSSVFIRRYGSFEHDSTFPDRFILEQYTGLKDKSGKEIYEGDIIEHYSGLVPKGADPYVKQIVRWNQYRWDGINNFNVSKIIGNIHENPELLEKAV